MRGTLSPPPICTTSAGVSSGNAQRDRREVVDDLEPFEAQRLLELALREAPVDVDHLDFVAGDRRRDGQRRARRTVARAAMVEIDAEDAGDAGEVGVLENFGSELLAFVVEKRAARRRRADVGHQIHEAPVRRSSPGFWRSRAE